jgi:hypothetical protein
MLVALVTLAIILILLYSGARSVVKTMMVTPAMAFFAARAIGSCICCTPTLNGGKEVDDSQ